MAPNLACAGRPGEPRLALQALHHEDPELVVQLLGSEFSATDAEQLYAGAIQLPWGELVARGQTIAVAATGRAAGLTHTHFVEQKLKDAVVDALRDKAGFRPDVDPKAPGVLIVAHLASGACSVSLDLAGDLLSNRGYRVRTVEAPLREALAAAVVLYSGWNGATPLRDPLCGSGALALEAALLSARRAPHPPRPPGRGRWPRASAGDALALGRPRAGLAAREVEPAPIFASDRDPEAD